MTEHQLLLKFVLVVVFLSEKGICKLGTYVIGFHNGLSGCQDFSNDLFNGDDLDLGKSYDDGKAAMFLEGCLEFMDTVDEGSFIDIDIEKETELGSEPMWSYSMDVCKSLKDDNDALWAEAMRSLNITGCPVAKGKYCCKECRLDLSFTKDFLNHEYRGIYATYIKISDSHMNALSCHQLELSIFQQDSE